MPTTLPQPRCSRRCFVRFALGLVAVAAVWAGPAAADGATCPRVPQSAIAAAIGLPHIAVQSDDALGCHLLVWSGHKPLPGKPSKTAEKTGRLALLTVKAEDLHEPYSEAHDNGFTNMLIPNKGYIESFYTPFAISTYGAEAELAGVGKDRASSFQVIGLWWSFDESADVQIYLGQYRKSGLQLEHELAAIAAQVVPAFGL